LDHDQGYLNNFLIAYFQVSKKYLQ